MNIYLFIYFGKYCIYCILVFIKEKVEEEDAIYWKFGNFIDLIESSLLITFINEGTKVIF